MKKICLLFIIGLSAIALRAQVGEAEKNAALQLVQKNTAAIGLSPQDLENVAVSSTYINGNSDIRMVYLQQTYKNIPVFNRLMVLAFKGDKVVSVAGTRIKNIEQHVNIPSAVPVISAADAIRAAMLDRKLAIPQNISSIASMNGKLQFGKLGVAFENITAELVWLPVGKNVYLTWEIFLSPNGTDDMWMIRIDATNQVVLDKNNLTVYDAWRKGGETNLAAHKTSIKNFVTRRIEKVPAYHPFIVGSATYRVIPYPAENPNVTPASLTTNPWTWAPGAATALGWHNDGATDYTTSRGNNVYAQEDRDANNNTFGQTANSSTAPDPLTFDFTPDYTITPTNFTNQQFAITNLFYWNNLMHDISYQYGFNEVAGNFQQSNQSLGGLGNDYVIADAQDAGGTNNANFGTPVDGTRPRMQMYLFTYTSPNRDGDIDNGVVSHEYTHGISTRLTGGPANSSCLNNAEEGGEGWSDYFALMVTTNWAAATVNDGDLARPIGTYVLGQPVTGPGIRQHPYSTNMSTDPWTYSDMTATGGEVHDIGEIWCTALWEMTWEIIKTTNQINTNLFNAPGAGGNSVALRLVMEGLKLQPCSPGYIDARNAILKADTLYFGSQYSCAIWRAFAKRGMGRYANQGSSNSTSDQVADFTPDGTIFRITQNAPIVAETQNIVYTNALTAGACTPINNYYVTDTLPNSVTYVSGGSYNATNRTVTFSPITLAVNQAQNFTFTVNVNSGTYFTPVDHINDVVGATIPSTWTATSTTSNVWAVSTTSSHSAPNSYFTPDPNGPTNTEQILTSTNSYTLSNAVAAYSTLSFWHKYNTEEGWDGGVVEISTNGGSTWQDLGNKMFVNGYNGSVGTGSALAGRQAFTGSSNVYIQTKINLSSYAGQTVKIRFRFAADNNTAPAGGGWNVDDIVLRSEPAVYMKSSLFNNLNVRQTTTDTVTQITNSCITAAINAQPVSASACPAGSATFTVGVTGTLVTYQWQENTGSGFANLANNATYTGVNTATLTINNVTAAMSGYQYRCIVGNSCTANVTSGSATLSLGSAPTVTAQPGATTGCAGSNTSFTVGASGASLTYQWQVNSGSGFNNISNTSPYSGVNTATLSINPVSAIMNGYQYRCVVTSSGCTQSTNSNGAILSVNTPPSINSQPTAASVCPGVIQTFAVTASGSTITYQWQINSGSGFTNLNNAVPYSGVNTATLTINPVATSMSGYQYRCVVSGACSPAANSNSVALTVYTPSSITGQPINASVCEALNTNFAVTAAGSALTYQWQLNTGTGFNNVTGATGSTLAITGATTAQNGNQYRVIVTGNCGTLTSNNATLTVNPRPNFTLSAPNTLCLSDTARSLFASLPGGTWTGTGISGTTFVPGAAGLGTHQVNYTATNANGCSNTQSASIVVNECPERHRSLGSKDAIKIYPSPGNGKFTIEFNSDLYTKLGVKVYDANGKYLGVQQYNGLFYGSRLTLDLREFESGVYFLYLFNDNNGKIERVTRKVVIAH